MSCGPSTAGDWFYHGPTESCFFLSKTNDTWDNAESACLNMSSHLASITEADHYYVRTVLRQNSPMETDYWIGLRLLDPSRMTHRWVDGSNENMYREWDTGEPNAKGLQDCGVINTRTGKFRDQYCQQPVSLRFICKKSKMPIIPKPAAVGWSPLWGCPTNCRNCVAFRKSVWVTIFWSNKH